MRLHFSDAWTTLSPSADDPHGPLPPLLVLLTVVTGLVDAFSYLELGRVFVANMTGNVVFLAFALGGAQGFIWWASLLAIFTFSFGALVGGRIRASHGSHRGRHLLVAAGTQTLLLLAAFAIAIGVNSPSGNAERIALIVLLGTGMGVQNATARALGVPDLTTTVLTLTLTGITADSSVAGGSDSKIGRRLLSILSMFFGALVGSLLIVKSHDGAWVLLIATALLGFVTIASLGPSRSTGDWAYKK
jgi:uncharacterized membrane protein YoaK (UPF0700 family)